jgi:hypothetical protein
MASEPHSPSSAKLAERFGVPIDRVDALERAIRPHYPGDEMMIELRTIRTLSAVREGRLTIGEAIEEFAQSARQDGARRA